MHIVGVIPARYRSSRFPGKPLAQLCGQPMIQWVYTHCRQVSEFAEVYVATDDARIQVVCEGFGAPVIMTSPEHDTATERLYEVAQTVAADFYVMVNGDEPLVTAETIARCIPAGLDPQAVLVTNLMTDFTDPVEVVDPTNLKVVTNAEGVALFISRSPIPFPKGSLNFTYQKFVGVGGFTMSALDYYHATPRGPVEIIEENDSFRFIENRKDVYYINAQCKTLSVDTPKDLDKAADYLAALYPDLEIIALLT
jgi:3-deoxy-manno-octulosonate cytidylyltransferase (CMP-KDO synthetase)